MDRTGAGGDRSDTDVKTNKINKGPRRKGRGAEQDKGSNKHDDPGDFTRRGNDQSATEVETNGINQEPRRKGRGTKQDRC